jgi:hypothetical protein
MGLLSLVMGPILAVLRRLMLGVVDASSLIGSLVVAGLVGAAFVALMLAAGYGLKIAEITDVMRRSFPTSK